MSDQWDDNTYDDDEPDSSNPVRARLRELEKQNKDLKKQLKARRGTEIESILKAKGVSTKYAKHWPEDKDATEDAVLKFLRDEYDIEVKSDAATDEAQADADKAPPADSPDPETVDALGKIQAAADGAIPQTQGSNAASNMKRLMDEALKTGDKSKFDEYVESLRLRIPSNHQ